MITPEQTIFMALVFSGVALVLSIWSLIYSYRWREIHRKTLPDRKSPPSPRLIQMWENAMEGYPEGSPKYEAYKARLIEVGVLPSGD